MKRIILHLQALAVLLPCLLIFVNGNLELTIVGILYLVWLAFFAAPTPAGKRFIRRYYHEILKIENAM
ncbi:MAG: hypothetical protein IJV08_11425 [Bacteroidaceae bacterium]|nr:hypothetical protein [Bacteroidaceae bacterium]MBR1449532.1 hypothetical protein [Prevotella sp.]